MSILIIFWQHLQICSKSSTDFQDRQSVIRRFGLWMILDCRRSPSLTFVVSVTSVFASHFLTWENRPFEYIQKSTTSSTSLDCYGNSLLVLMPCFCFTATTNTTIHAPYSPHLHFTNLLRRLLKESRTCIEIQHIQTGWQRLPLTPINAHLMTLDTSTWLTKAAKQNRSRGQTTIR